MVDSVFDNLVDLLIVFLGFRYLDCIMSEPNLVVDPYLKIIDLFGDQNPFLRGDSKFVILSLFNLLFDESLRGK